MSVPVPVPEAGLRLSQAAVSVAVQVKVPPPVLLSVTDWLAAVVLFSCAVSVTLRGVAPIAGGTGAAVIVKETGIATVVAPGALTFTDVL